MTEEQQYSMQEREKEQCDWKVSKPKQQHHTRNSHESERARRQYESWSYQSTCAQSITSTNSSGVVLLLRSDWRGTETPQWAREQRAQFQSRRIDEHKWEYERERANEVCVWWKNSRAIILQEQEEEGCVGIVVVVVVGGAWVKSCVCAHLDTKQGRPSTKALNVNVTHTHTHIVCLVGRVTIERELAVS